MARLNRGVGGSGAITVGRVGLSGEDVANCALIAAATTGVMLPALLVAAAPQLPLQRAPWASGK
ncbi:MAG: hypothetical protein JOY71_31295 [Acetobacteraceae bacterium]|nr:hypothetical protein [Acetobacteraceae bacterium]